MNIKRFYKDIAGLFEPFVSAVAIHLQGRRAVLTNTLLLTMGVWVSAVGFGRRPLSVGSCDNVQESCSCWPCSISI